MATNITDIQGSPRPGGLIVYGTQPQRLGGVCAPGTAIAANDVNLVVVHCLGAGRVRVRARVTGGGGNIRARYRMADHKTAATAGNPADVALVTAVENVMDFDAKGAAHVEVGIANGAGANVIDYVEVELLPL